MRKVIVKEILNLISDMVEQKPRFDFNAGRIIFSLNTYTK